MAKIGKPVREWEVTEPQIVPKRISEPEPKREKKEAPAREREKVGV